MQMECEDMGGVLKKTFHGRLLVKSCSGPPEGDRDVLAVLLMSFILMWTQ